MRKKIIGRCLMGAPIGFAITTIITVIISFAVGDGKFYPVVPEMIEDFGSEINAVAVQMLLSFLYGAAWAGASVIWETESWSLLRQTVTHLIIGSVFSLPVAYVCRWMEHSVWSVAGYFATFFMIYFGIWLVQYFSAKRKISKMNEQIENKTE